VDQKAKRRASRERREHTGCGTIEVERDDRERAGDDHAHAGRQPVHAIGEVDDVHHRDQPDHGERRTGVCRARFGERERTDERQRDALDRNAVVHDDHRRRDLAGELDDRGQVEAVVQRANDRYQRGADQHAMPHLRARAVAGGQEREYRNEHAGEDRKTAEQRRRAIGEAALTRFVHGADRPRQPHRERREQRGYGRGNKECGKRVELSEMRHRLAHSIAGAGVVSPTPPPHMERGPTCGSPRSGACA
jgi:hypothetical protein